jgi:hypothetical protein
MNQGMLVLLLALLSGSNTYLPAASKQENQLVKAGESKTGAITTGSLIRQLNEIIDTLQRVEQIGRLADFSTIRKKENMMPGEEYREPGNSYFSNIKEAFSNVADLLGGENDDRRGRELTVYKQEAEDGPKDNRGGHTNSASGSADDAGGLGNLAGLASLLGGSASQEELIQTLGKLINSMNTGGGKQSQGRSQSAGAHRTGDEPGAGDYEERYQSDGEHGGRYQDNAEHGGRAERGGRSERGSRSSHSGSAGGVDIDKLTKMVNLISAINRNGKK